MTNQTATQRHARMTASIMRDHGFKAEATKSSNVIISLNNRRVGMFEVQRVIGREELPINHRHIHEMSGNVYIMKRAFC